MKKHFVSYSIFWAILVAVFNVIAFVSAGWAAYAKYTPSFWIGYVFITLAFIGQLACAFAAFKCNDAKKLFYRLSLVKIAHTGLVASFVFGGLCMIIAPLPYWVGILVCFVILAFNIIAVVKSTVAIEEVERIDNKIKTDTFFIKYLTVEAKSLMAGTDTDKLHIETKRVYEAICYSDPMSNAMLAEIENQIERQYIAFADAVRSGDFELAKKSADILVQMIEKRNQTCKLLK